MESIGLLVFIVALLLGLSGLVFFVIGLVAGCGREPNPRHVDDDDPNMD